MDEMERELGRLKFASPPPWLKARTLVAAENVLEQQARGRRFKYAAVAVIAAGFSLAVVGMHIADAIAPIFGKADRSFSYEAPGRSNLGDMGPLPVNLLPPPDKPGYKKTSAPAKEEDDRTPPEDADDPDEKTTAEDERENNGADDE